MNVTLTHIDTCLPCFLTDHHNRDGECLLGVHVDGRSKMRDVHTAVLDEWRQTDDRVPLEVTGDKFVAALDAAFAGIDPDRLFDASLGIVNDENLADAEEAGDEVAQAWFLLKWELPEDGEIVGYDPANGSILQHNGDTGETYNCGDSPEQFGLDNISPEEIKRLERDGWTRAKEGAA